LASFKDDSFADLNISNQLVLVVDFGAQYAQLIARRIRQAGIYSEVISHKASANEILAKKPVALVLSGGPASVYEAGAPALDEKIFESDLPIFGICYGFQVMAQSLGGKVAQTGKSEFGRTKLKINKSSKLFHSLADEFNVWMSHGDSVSEAPDGFSAFASTADTDIVAFENESGLRAGVQFHPEVLHCDNGQAILEKWLRDIVGLKPTWESQAIVDLAIAKVKAQVGQGKVLCGLSGGVDSAVAAAIVQKAVGDQLTCVFVDHGLLRSGEVEQVERDFVASTGVKLITVDAKAEFLAALAGVTDPESKRKIIGREFIRAFERVARELNEGAGVDFLVQGTLYPDVVESGGGSGTANIKSHHNVGGLPADLKFTLVEPLRDLFKDEVRQAGLTLGLPSEIVWRQPFPGPGLAIRIVGEVNEGNLSVLRKADEIARQEFTSAGLDRIIWQSPVVLLASVRSVGVQGDGRTYGHPIVLRPVSSEDAMTADWVRVPYDVLEKISTRITNEVREVNRVLLDLTSKPPGTIEWE
jgi:GMP synthase (glutamine-hydrolysing)